MIATTRCKGGREQVREYLIEAREKAGLTQQDVANRIGISRQYYQMVETGERQKRMDLSLAGGLSVVLNEDFAKMILGMMEAREKERMLGIRVLIIAHNAYKFQGCAQIYRNYLPQHIAIHVRKQYLAELNRKRKGGRNAQGDSH